MIRNILSLIVEKYGLCVGLINEAI